MSATKYTCILEFESDEELVAKCRAIIAAKAQDRPPAMTVGQLAALVGRDVSSVSNSLRAVLCPPFKATRSPTGKKIMLLEANETLIAFLGGRKKERKAAK